MSYPPLKVLPYQCLILHPIILSTARRVNFCSANSIQKLHFFLYCFWNNNVIPNMICKAFHNLALAYILKCILCFFLSCSLCCSHWTFLSISQIAFAIQGFAWIVASKLDNFSPFILHR